MLWVSWNVNTNRPSLVEVKLKEIDTDLCRVGEVVTLSKEEVPHHVYEQRSNRNVSYQNSRPQITFIIIYSCASDYKTGIDDTTKLVCRLYCILLIYLPLLYDKMRHIKIKLWVFRNWFLILFLNIDLKNILF